MIVNMSMVKLVNLYWYSERHDIGCRLTVTRFGRVPPRPERTHRSGFGNGPASAQAAHVRSAQGGGSGKCRYQPDLVHAYRTGPRRVGIIGKQFAQPASKDCADRKSTRLNSSH